MSVSHDPAAIPLLDVGSPARKRAIRSDGSARKHTSETAEHFTPPAIVTAARSYLGGEVELDPASCDVANRTVLARRIYTQADDGLAREWRARTVFLNPPGGLVDADGRRVTRARTELDDAGRKVKVPGCTQTGSCGLPPGHKHQGVESSAVRWWVKLATAIARGSVESAVFVAFSFEILQTSLVEPAHTSTPHVWPIWWPRTRIAYWTQRNGVLAEGPSPPGGSFVVGLRHGDRSVRLHAAQTFADAFGVLGGLVTRGEAL